MSVRAAAAKGNHVKFCCPKCCIQGLNGKLCGIGSIIDKLYRLDLINCTADPCVYIKKKADRLTIVVVYVDDLNVIANTAEEMTKVKEDLTVQFRMKDLGNLHYCLGITIERDEDQHCLWLHQRQYISSILVKYRVTEANIVSTPIDLSVKLQKDDKHSKQADPVLYQSIIGSLLYAAIATRPDIAYAVGVVSKFSSRPTEAHLKAAK